MNKPDHSIVISNSNDANKETSICFESNKVSENKNKKNLIATNESLKDISLDCCQHLFACLVCFLLINPNSKDLFKQQNEGSVKRQSEDVRLDQQGLKFFLQMFLHFRYTPTKKDSSVRNVNKKNAYIQKIIQAQKDIIDNKNHKVLNAKEFETVFKQLCLDFFVLPDNLRKSAIEFILESLKDNQQQLSPLANLLNDVLLIHDAEKKQKNDQRFNSFKKNFAKIYKDNHQPETLFGLFTAELTQDGRYSVLAHGKGKFEKELNFVLEKYNGRKENSKRKINGIDALLNRIKEKLNAGRINAVALSKIVNNFNKENPDGVREDILIAFLNKAFLESEQSKLDDSCELRILFYLCVAVSIFLKISGTLLLNSAFLFGLAAAFKGFDINFVGGSSTSIEISIALGALTLVIWYGAALATWFSRVAKIKKTIRKAWFSDEAFEPESLEDLKHPTLRKNMKMGLLYFVAPIAAVASGLPAFYGSLKTVNTLGNAFGCQISESQIWLISVGMALAFGSGVSFFCFYTFKLSKSVDNIIEKWGKKDKSFFFITACFTLILGVVYFFAIRGALSELAAFALSHDFNFFILKHQTVAHILESPIFFGILFGSLMLINFFSVLDYTARLLKPSQSLIQQHDDSGLLEIDLDPFSTDSEKQANDQICAKALYNLERRKKFKLSIAIIDVFAFSVFGGIMSSNKVLSNWYCAHFEGGNVIYNPNSLGSNIMMMASCAVSILALAALWNYQKMLGMKTRTATIVSVGLFALVLLFLFCPWTTSIFFTLTVVAANIFVSLAFTHFINTFLLGTKIPDNLIVPPHPKGIFKPANDELDKTISSNIKIPLIHQTTSYNS